jgi:membrane protein YdbS with pleckstrin-like domain
MGLPAKLLADDEEVVRHMHTHWKALALPALVLVVSTGLAAYAAAALPDNAAQRWLRILILLLWLAIFVLFVAAPFVRWYSTTYTLTNRRIIVRGGIVSRYGRDMPLSRMNDVHFESGPIDRMIGCGTIIVESAGERGQMVLKDVPDFEQVQLELYELHEEDDERRRRDIGEGEPGGRAWRPPSDGT